jgi:NADH-quinone oxidoreductase subunit N
MSQIGLSLISLSCINLNPFLAISFSIFNFFLYIFSSLIFFIILFIGLFEKDFSLNEISLISISIENLKEYNNYLIFLLTLLILSMSGIPPLTGFFTKYLIFSLLFNKFPIIIFLLLILNLINTYNYLRLIQIM